MKKDDLRKVEYKDRVEVQEESGIWSYSYEKFHGYFHMWFNCMDYADGFQESKLYGIIENEDGRIVYIEPVKIKFIN